MKRVWTLLEGLLYPPKWVLLTLPPIVFTALTYVLLKGKNSMPTYYTIILAIVNLVKF